MADDLFRQLLHAMFQPILTRLDDINNKLEVLTVAVTTLQNALDALKTTVEQEVTVEQSVITFIKGLPAIIQAAVDKALSAGTLTPAQQAAFDELQTTIATSSTNLAAAVTANTPAAP